MTEGDVPPVALAEQPQSNKRLWKFGAWVTGAWLGGFAIYVFICWAAVVKMHPNEFGDFLAGVFAPLAFLWLVLGFFQQGEELQNSAAALWLQGRELQNSVEQQRELVNVTREQLKFESEVLQQQRDEMARNAQPVLSITGGMMTHSSGIMTKKQFYVGNHGKTCTKFRVRFTSARKVVCAQSIDMLERGQRISCEFDPSKVHTTALYVTATYLDERMVEGKKRWRLYRTGDKYAVKVLGEEADQDQVA